MGCWTFGALRHEKDWVFRDTDWSERAHAHGKSRPYVSQRVKLLKLHPKLREVVRRRTITPDHAHALMRLKNPEQQLALAEQVQAKGLSVHETRQRVRELLGKEFKWRLVPLRLNPETYEALQRIAPEGDVKRLIQETIEKLVQT